METRQSGNGLFRITGSCFSEHRDRCERCQRYREGQPATAALLCMDGAVLLKDREHVPSRRAPVVRDEFYAPAKKGQGIDEVQGE
jgi:hypothetical protein